MSSSAMLWLFAEPVATSAALPLDFMEYPPPACRLLTRATPRWWRRACSPLPTPIYIFLSSYSFSSLLWSHFPPPRLYPAALRRHPCGLSAYPFCCFESRPLQQLLDRLTGLGRFSRRMISSSSSSYTMVVFFRVRL